MTTEARQKFEHSEKTASCPTCGSDKREVKFTSHFSGMPILECSDPWHGWCPSGDCVVCKALLEREIAEQEK